MLSFSLVGIGGGKLQLQLCCAIRERGGPAYFKFLEGAMKLLSVRKGPDTVGFLNMDFRTSAGGRLIASQ